MHGCHLRPWPPWILYFCRLLWGDIVYLLTSVWGDIQLWTICRSAVSFGSAMTNALFAGWFDKEALTNGYLPNLQRRPTKCVPKPWWRFGDLKPAPLWILVTHTNPWSYASHRGRITRLRSTAIGSKAQIDLLIGIPQIWVVYSWTNLRWLRVCTLHRIEWNDELNLRLWDGSQYTDTK